MNRTVTKNKTSFPASGFTSVAAQLLVRRGGRVEANGDSLEFFSDLRKCQPEPRFSRQTEPGRPEDGRGMTRRRGSSAGSDELLSSEIGKHDYDWLLTPPVTPLQSPATSSSEHEVSAVVQNQLTARNVSASYAKSYSRLGRTGQKQNVKSRLARSSSAAHSSSMNTPAIAWSFGGHLPRVRTLSSASVPCINTAGSSTSLVAVASSPRTPVTARSTARPCRPGKAPGKQATGSAVVARQPWALSSSKSSPRNPAPTCSRPSVASSPRSTTSMCQQQVPPAPSKRANNAVLARSRLASQSCGTGSTSQPRRDVHLTRDARSPPSSSSSCNSVKTWAVNKTILAAKVTTAQHRRRQSLAPAMGAALSALREASVDNDGSPRNSNVGRKISEDKPPVQRTSTTAAGGSGLASRTGPRFKSANSNAPTNAGRLQDAEGTPAQRKPSMQRWRSGSVSSMSRIGLTRTTTSEASAGSISNRRSVKLVCADQLPLKA